MERDGRPASCNGDLGLPVPALLLLLVCGATPAEPAQPALFIFSDPASASHRGIVDRIMSRFDASAGGRHGLVVHDLGDQSIAESGVQETDRALVIAVGTKAAGEVSQNAPDVPVLNVFLPLVTYQHLHETAGRKSAAIVLDQPLERQLALARALLPDAQSAAMLQSDAAPMSWPLSPGQTRIFDFALAITVVKEDDAPVAAIREVLRRGDVVIATFDPHVYTPALAKWLLYMALQQQRPIIGFSHALLEAGALASVFSTPEQFAEHTIELIEDWLTTGRVPVGVAHPRYYHIGVNAPVARQLGVVPADKADVRRQVHKLLEDER